METNYWICDSCGGRINEVKDGYLQWLNRGVNLDRTSHKMVIVHHNQDCQFDERKEFLENNSTVSDMDLEYFSGSTGLIRLLEMISDDRFENKEEVLETIKRIHVPGYEKTRPYFQSAISEGVVEPNSKLRYFSQEDLETIKDYYDLD